MIFTIECGAKRRILNNRLETSDKILLFGITSLNLITFLSFLAHLKALIKLYNIYIYYKKLYSLFDAWQSDEYLQID